MTVTTAQNITDIATLEECETVIRRSLAEAAAALGAIRDRRLYLEAGYATFELYCFERLGFTRKRADQIIVAGRVIAALPTDVGRALTTEAQVRALGPVKHDPDLASDIVREVASAGRVTATAIRGAIAARNTVPANEDAVLARYELHDLTAALPWLPDDQMADMVRSVRTHGLLHPIKLDHTGTVLVDGKVRLVACCRAGVEPLFERLPEDCDLWDYSVALNLVRQDLSSDQRAMILADIEPAADDAVPPDPLVASIDAAVGSLVDATSELLALRESGSIAPDQLAEVDAFVARTAVLFESLRRGDVGHAMALLEEVTS